MDKADVSLQEANILIIEPGSGYGGSSSYLLSFLKYLNREKYVPLVLCYSQGKGPNIQRIESLGIEVISLNERSSGNGRSVSLEKNRARLISYCCLLMKMLISDLPRIIKIVTIIRQRGVKIVLLNSEVHFNVPGIIAAKVCNIPCVVRKSGVGADHSLMIRGILSGLVDSFISSSDAETNFHKKNKWPYKKMVTVSEGTDLKYFKTAPKQYVIHGQFRMPQDSFIVGSISRLETGKGHEDLIRAAQIVACKNKKIIFLIVGEDVDSGAQGRKDELKRLAFDLGIGKNVIFAGWRTDVKDILNDIDVFVHCPNVWREGMGIATLEALACGKPVIVTENWGLAETVIEGYNGFIVPIGDYKKIGERIISLYNDVEMVRTMGNNSRHYAESKFDMENNVKKIEKIIEETLTGVK